MQVALTLDEGLAEAGSAEINATPLLVPATSASAPVIESKRASRLRLRVSFCSDCKVTTSFLLSCEWA